MQTRWGYIPVIKTLFILIATVFLLGDSNKSPAQSGMKKYNVVARLAKLDTGRIKIKNFDAIIEAPRIICDVPGVKVTSCTVSFQPKGADFIGPYKVAGEWLSSNAAVMTSLRQLNGSGAGKTTFFVEEIHAAYKGEDILLAPIIINVVPGTR